VARFIPLSLFQSLLVLGALLGVSAVRTTPLLAQATATLHASARVVSTETVQAGQANGITLARETLEAAEEGITAGIEMRRELHGTALVARVIEVPASPTNSQKGSDPVRRVQVTVHYAAN
jgi:hypothetical protein